MILQDADTSKTVCLKLWNSQGSLPAKDAVVTVHAVRTEVWNDVVSLNSTYPTNIEVIWSSYIKVCSNISSQKVINKKTG